MTALIQVTATRWVASAADFGTALLAEADKAPELDADTRARWMLALIGLLILGVGWILIVWLAGRMTRRFTDSDTLGTPSIYSEFGRTDWVRSNRREAQDERDANSL